MLLDKVRKEKDELRDSNSQLECHTNDLKASLCRQKETLTACGCRAEIAENQPPNFILQLAELQCKMNSQPCSVATIFFLFLGERELSKRIFR